MHISWKQVLWLINGLVIIAKIIRHLLTQSSLVHMAWLVDIEVLRAYQRQLHISIRTLIKSLYIQSRPRRHIVYRFWMNVNRLCQILVRRKCWKVILSIACQFHKAQAGFTYWITLWYKIQFSPTLEWSRFSYTLVYIV